MSDQDLVTFTKKILNGKLHFLCSDSNSKNFMLVILISSSTIDKGNMPGILHFVTKIFVKLVIFESDPSFNLKL